MYITHMFLHALSFYEHLYLCISVAPLTLSLPAPWGSCHWSLHQEPSAEHIVLLLLTSISISSVGTTKRCKAPRPTFPNTSFRKYDFYFVIALVVDLMLLTSVEVTCILSFGNQLTMCAEVDFSVIWCWFGWDLKMQASWLNLFAIFLVDLSIQSFLTFPFSSRVSLIEKVNLDDQDHKVSCAEITKSKFHTFAPYLSIYHANFFFALLLQPWSYDQTDGGKVLEALNLILVGRQRSHRRR